MGNIQDMEQITVRNQKGEKIVCDVLFTYEDEETKKNYICYTDYSLEANGRTRVYTSLYDPDSENAELKPIEDEAQLKALEDILNELQEEIKDSVKNGGNIWPEIEDLQNASDYIDIGEKAYKAKNYVMAEKVFLRALELEDNISTRNNLAYMIRRKEVEEVNRYSEKDVVALLREGVKKKDAFSTINMALFWALNKGEEDDWKLADELIGNLKKGTCSEAVLWWEQMGKRHEAEGYLVHLLLVRHGIIKASGLGNQEILYAIAKRKYDNLPKYMREAK